MHYLYIVIVRRQRVEQGSSFLKKGGGANAKSNSRAQHSTIVARAPGHYAIHPVGPTSKNFGPATTENKSRTYIARHQREPAPITKISPAPFMHRAASKGGAPKSKVEHTDNCYLQYSDPTGEYTEVATEQLQQISNPTGEYTGREWWTAKGAS